MAIYRGPGGSGDATQDAASEVLLALQAKDAAIAAQVAAEAARDAAQLAETNAETAETNAETAETNAETAQTAAEAAQAAAEAVLTDPDFVTVVGIEADITTVAGIAADVTTVAGISADVTTVAGIDQTDLADVAAIDTDVTTVAGISTNVTSVAGIASDVTTVATNNANVTTVATNIANVNAVGSNIANVNAVAANETNINAVEANETNINTVAGISANVTTVAGISANVTTVAGISANVTTVAGIDADVTTVAGIDTEVTTVAGIAANVTSVAGNATNINTVATDIANVNAVGTNIANVNSVAGNSANINTVAGISANVTTVAGISGNVTTVANNNANVTTVATNIASVNTNATNIANINQNAANITAIQNASANATAAANSATAAATSATNAATSAAQASAVALGNEPVRHSVRPSLLLDFANTRTLDPRITFTRGSTGTFYDGRTVAKAEENLLVQSTAFNDTPNWTTTNLVIAANTGDTTAPDGTSTAERLTDDATNGVHRVSTTQVVPLIVNTPYAASVFVKAGTHNFVQLILRDGNTAERYITIVANLSTGAITQTAAGTSATLTSSAITSVGNSWFRIQMVGSFAGVGTPAQNQFQIAFAGAATGNTIGTFGTIGYVGTGTTFYVWGAQLEQRSSVTAYTATTTAPITNYIPALQTAAANVARFDHNPTTGESLGLLIEEQRANLFQRSDDFADSYWVLNNATVTSNTVVAPDGMLTGDNLVENTANNVHLVGRSLTIAANTNYTYSVYVKAAGRTKVVLRFAKNGTPFTSNNALFDLSAVTATTSSTAFATTNTPTITHVGNGWYRCTMGGVLDASSTDGAFQIRIVDASNNTTYTGDGYSGLYIWGAQLEAGAFATSYIPTVAASATRSADAASMTGTNFSSWYRADEGTLYSEATFTNTVSFNTVVALGDGTTNNTMRTIQWNDGTDRTWQIVNSGVSQANYNGTGQVGTAKFAGAYKFNDCNASKNGSSNITDTSAVLPIVNALYIGATGPTIFFLNGSIRKLAFYPRRLTNAELQGLTTV